MPETSPSVLIVRLDAVGDALALTPLIAGLRARGCRIGIVLRDVNAGAFAHRTFDRVHIARFGLRSGSRPNRREIDREGEAIAAFAYTHALIATEDPGGYRLARAAAVPVRIGFENGWGKPFKTLWVRTLCTQTVRRTAGLDERAPHEAAVLFKLGRSLLGSEAHASRDLGVLRELVIDDETAPDSRITLQVTDKWERLGASIESVAEVAHRIGLRHALRAIASTAEGAYADRFTAATGVPVERFSNLAPWKAAIAAAPVLVAPDSGALHVAGMVGTPVVAAFAPTPAYALQSARWAPWAAPYRNLAMHGAWPIVAADAVDDLLSGRLPIYRG
ncbi:MAG TPA: glycosyltransferase family 9 protein [Candidatus Baltobacteraceae bacterium]|jgi:ADP-heptose:LPS heptosyltransferase